jgi:hypothetical protein
MKSLPHMGSNETVSAITCFASGLKAFDEMVNLRTATLATGTQASLLALVHLVGASSSGLPEALASRRSDSPD